MRSLYNWIPVTPALLLSLVSNSNGDVLLEGNLRGSTQVAQEDPASYFEVDGSLQSLNDVNQSAARRSLSTHSSNGAIPVPIDNDEYVPNTNRKFNRDENTDHRGGYNARNGGRNKTISSSMTMMAPDKRIVGGYRVTDNRAFFAMTMDMDSNGEYFRGTCGASLIGKKFAVTAAHCISNSKKDDLRSKMDALYLNPVDPYEANPSRNGGRPYAKADILRAIEHPNHVPGSSSSWDIAILELAEEMPAFFAPVAVADQSYIDDLPAGEPLTTMGLGSTVKDGSRVDQLREVNVPYMKPDECQKAMERWNWDDTMVCAGAEDKDACGGDSGGPLMHGQILLGVVSWGVGCGNPKYYGVYGKIAKALPWIQQFGIEDLKIVSAGGVVRGNGDGSEHDVSSGGDGHGGVVSYQRPQLSSTSPTTSQPIQTEATYSIQTTISPSVATTGSTSTGIMTTDTIAIGTVVSTTATSSVTTNTIAAATMDVTTMATAEIATIEPKQTTASTESKGEEAGVYNSCEDAPAPVEYYDARRGEMMWTDCDKVAKEADTMCRLTLIAVFGVAADGPATLTDLCPKTCWKASCAGEGHAATWAENAPPQGGDVGNHDSSVEQMSTLNDVREKEKGGGCKKNKTGKFLYFDVKRGKAKNVHCDKVSKKPWKLCNLYIWESPYKVMDMCPESCGMPCV